MNRDRDLLFGILAVQLQRVTREQSAAAGALWVADPSRSLGDYLVESHALSEADRHVVDNALENTIEASGGDASKALESVGGEKQIHESFMASLVLTESGHLCSTIPFLPLGTVRAIADVAGVQETPGRYTPVGEYGRGGMGRVLLVGQPTNGAGGGPTIVKLSDGTRVAISRALGLRANGVVFEGHGIAPHIYSAPTLNSLREGRDAALDIAKEWIESGKDLPSHMQPLS